MMLLALLPARASVQVDELVTSGSGATLGDAINFALLEAIAQNSGRRLESHADLRRVLTTTEGPASSPALLEETVASRVRSATQGEVLGYRILEQGTGRDGSSVRLAVRVPRYERSEQASRLRIAVPPFRDAAGDNALSLAAAMATRNALVQTRRLAVLERDWEAESAREEHVLMSAAAARDERTRLGRRLGADLLLLATLKNVWLGPAGAGLLAPVARAAVDFRLVDFATGQVKMAREIKVAVNRAQLGLADAGDAARDALAVRIAGEITDAVTETAFPLTIVSVANAAEFALNQGGDALFPGRRYAVYALGDNVRDPHTGESLGRVETLVGVAEITRTTPKIGYARMMDRTVSVSEGMVLRRQLPAGGPATTPRVRDNDW